MLTITMIQCMPTGQATTRLHDVAHDHIAAAIPQTASWNNLKDFKSSDLHRRSDQATDVSLVDLASSFANSLPADVSILSGPLQAEATNISSALFALDLADSGIDLHSACSQLGTVSVKYNLLQGYYNPDNIQSIVCFIADYGYDFNTTRQMLFASLYAALIGVLAAGGVSTDRGQICANLDLFDRTGGYLGIDVQQYHDLICKYIPTSPTPVWYGPTPIIPYVTGGVTTWGTPTSWAANMTIQGTGTDTSGANDTGTGSELGPPVSYTGPISSGWSITINTQSNWTETQPTGTGLASGTAPASETGASASNDTLLAARTPRGRNAMPFYPAISTSESRAGVFKGY
jgi:hypothetical protein